MRSVPRRLSTACPAHPGRNAAWLCVACARPLCELCRGQIDDLDYCPTHFLAEEQTIRARSYGLPPLPKPIGIVEVLLGVWALIGAVAPWFPWYRTVVAGAGPISSAVQEYGWDAGGFAAVASLSLLFGGITVGFMVGLRAIRPRWVRRASVAGASVGFGATTLMLLGIRIATRYENTSTGIYLAVASGALLVYLGRRIQRGLS